MRFKILGFLCVAAFVGVLAFNFGHAQASVSPKPFAAAGNLPGRYQLTPATIEKIVPEPERVVFRVDSQTGQVWMLQLHSGSSGSAALYWSPIEEDGPKPN